MDPSDISLVENIVSAVIEHVFIPLEARVNGMDKKISTGKSMSDLKTQAKSDLISALNELKDQLDTKVVTLDENQRLDDKEKGIVRNKIDVYSKGEIRQQLNTNGADKNRIENIVKDLINNRHKQDSKSSLTEDLSQVIQTNAPLKNNLEGVLPGNQSSGSHKNNIQIKDWKISAGNAHSLAVSDKGDLYSWGDNVNGQLGREIQDDFSKDPGKVEFPQGIKIIQVTAGSLHSLALDSNGKLYSWGDNGMSQLGREIQGEQSDTPGKVGFPEEVKIIQVVTKGHHNLALKSTGELYSWGDNGDIGTFREAEIGSFKESIKKVEFPRELKIIHVAAGQWHSLALDSTGKLYSWGDNDKGQLGRIVDQAKPFNKPREVEQFPEMVKIIQAAVGNVYSLALDSTGNLYSWGINENGQLGREIQGRFSSIPEKVKFPQGIKIIQVAAGSAHSLALDNNGNLYSWGYNGSGELGRIVFEVKPSYKPAEIKFPKGVKIIQIATGRACSLALDSNGRLYSWGDNSSGQLGDGTTIGRDTPVEVKLPADFFSKQGPVSDS